jgi:hypothetical protein
MTATIQMQRRGDRLECMSPIWADMLDQFPQGLDLNVKITHARSVRQNALYWGLLGWVITNGPEWLSEQWPHADQLSDALQLETGYVRQIKLANGMVYGLPESKSFEEMKQAKFNAYFEAAQIKLTEWCQYDPLPIYLAVMSERGGRKAA